MLLDANLIAVTALALGVLALVARQLAAMNESGVWSPRAPVPPSAGGGARVRGRGIWSFFSLRAATPPRGAGRGARLEPGSGRARDESAAGHPAPRVYVGPEFQIDDFVQAMINYCGCEKWRDAAILEVYRAWARDGQIGNPVHDVQVLTLLAKHPNVRRTRERIKDPRTGRVMKLPSGTPVRASFYELVETPAAASRQKAVASSAASAAGEQGDPRRSRAPAERPERRRREDQPRERNQPETGRLVSASKKPPRVPTGVRPPSPRPGEGVRGERIAA
jgi:hypothetical protein